MFRYLVAFLLIFILQTITYTKICYAQLIAGNDDFEGPFIQGSPPPYWNNCNDGYSSVDTQPGSFHVFYHPSTGSSYISMVTRELNPIGTVEKVWAKSLIPLLKDSCYNFTIDFSLSDEFYGTYDWDDYYFNNPCILQIFGFNGDCNNPQETELLWESNLLDNFEWQTFEVNIKPLLASYNFIAMRPFFYPANNFKNSVVLVDNLQLKKSDHLFIEIDHLLRLPLGSSNIQWYFNNLPVLGANSLEMPIMGSGKYGATFYDSKGCYTFTNLDFILDVTELSYYPNPASNTLIIESLHITDEIYTVKVHDELGRIVLNIELLFSKGSYKSSIDLTNLTSAVYFVSIMRPQLAQLNFKLLILK